MTTRLTVSRYAAGPCLLSVLHPDMQLGFLQMGAQATAGGASGRTGPRHRRSRLTCGERANQPGRAASQPGANAPCFAAELAGLFLLLLNRPIAANDDKTSRSTANDDQNELMHADISDHVKCAV